MVASERTKLVSELGLADSGKLLVMLYGAREASTHIQEDYLDTYVYLLTADRVLNFNYPFRFIALTRDSLPLPYSHLLRTELQDLVHGDLVGKGSRIYLAPLGKRWVEDEVASAADFQEIMANICTFLKRYTAWDYSQLFQVIYAKL